MKNICKNTYGKSKVRSHFTVRSFTFLESQINRCTRKVQDKGEVHRKKEGLGTDDPSGKSFGLTKSSLTKESKGEGEGIPLSTRKTGTM